MLQAGFFVLALSWLMPGHYPPWMSFQAEFMACVGACFVGVGVVQRRTAVAVPLLSIVTFVAAIVPLLQLAFGQVLFHADAILAAGYLVGFALSMVAAATLIKHDKALFLDGLTAAFVVAAFISAALALTQWLDIGKGLFVNEIVPGDRPNGNLAQPNHLATLLALGLVGLIRWFETRRISAIPLALGAAWLGFALVLTQSRAGWLIVLVLGIWYASNFRRSGLRLSPVGVAVGISTFAAGVVGLRALNDVMLISTATSLSERVVKPGMRLGHWHTIWDALWSSPWVGFGWTQVSMAQRAGADSHPATSELMYHSHNLFLDLLVWNGVPVGLLLIAALVWWFVRQARACRSADQCAMFAGVAAIFVHAMVEYPLSYAYFLLPAGLMMGALDGLNDRERRLWAWPRAGFAVPFAICVGLTAFTGYEYLKVEEAARTVRLVGSRIGVDKVPVAPIPDVWLLDSQREYIRFVGTKARPGMSPEEVDWMRRITSRFTYASAMYRFALAAGLNGHPEEARAVLFTLCKIHGAERCEEGRVGWGEMQARYPQLASVAFPK